MKSAVHLGLSLLLVGCGVDDPFKHAIPKDDVEAYVRESCVYGFEDGGEVQAPTSRELRTVTFGKSIDYSGIRALHRASAKNTLAFIRTRGAEVYGAPDSGRRCLTFTSLTATPQDLGREWARASAMGGKDSVLMGLYVAPGTATVASSSSRALIAVRRDASRYTLVHEFAHHLFDTRARELGLPHADQARQNVRISGMSFDNFKSTYENDPTQVHFTTLVDRFDSALKHAKEFLLRFQLEEMAIETMLVEDYDRGLYEFFPLRKRSAYSYTANSGKTALEALDTFAGVLRGLKIEALDRRYNEANRLTTMDADLVNFQTEVSRRTTAARTEASRSQFEQTSDGDDTRIENIECSRTADADLEDLKTVIGRSIR